MKWYKPLYMGTMANKHKFRFISGIRQRKLLDNVYAVILAEESKNILEFYPSFVMRQEYYRKREFTIVGIGYGYEEAAEIVRQIIDDTYQQTGNLDVRAFLGL